MPLNFHPGSTASDRERARAIILRKLQLINELLTQFILKDPTDCVLTTLFFFCLNEHLFLVHFFLDNPPKSTRIGMIIKRRFFNMVSENIKNWKKVVVRETTKGTYLSDLFELLFKAPTVVVVLLGRVGCLARGGGIRAGVSWWVREGKFGWCIQLLLILFVFLCMFCEKTMLDTFEIWNYQNKMVKCNFEIFPFQRFESWPIKKYIWRWSSLVMTFTFKKRPTI